VSGAPGTPAPYAVSKAGVIMITRMFALHAADSGFTVNVVSPGTIVTAMAERLGTRIDPRDVPMNRMGTPEEVAQAVVFPASSMTSHITGQTLGDNCGQYMR
jgi:NAD(P)-dependent dehydrogenase (short-subunit alcohol dehydrogenase family)